MVRIAFLGLGAMGLPMARNLSRHPQIDVVVYDVSSERLARGAAFAETAESVKEAIQDADAIFSVVPADVHVQAVAADVAEYGRPGQIYADFSTISPSTIAAVAARLSEREIETVSLALTRSTAAAEAGELVLFSSQIPESIRSWFESALEMMSIEVRTVSGLGGPKAIKLANNMVIACIDVGVIEVLVLAEAVGLSAPDVTRGIKEGGADSWAIVNHIEKYVLPDDLGPGRFSTAYMAKDVDLFSAMALENGVPAVLAGLVSAQYRGTVAHGLGDHYHMIVKRWQEWAANRTAAEKPADRGIGETTVVDLARSVAGVHLLASEDALAAAHAWGVPREEAIDHLLGGSAGNEYLESLVPGGDSTHPPLESILASLDELAGLSERLSVPSILLEASRRLLRTAPIGDA